MTQNEFIEKVRGVKWENRKVSLDGMDCYGLVILYYRMVLGINLPVPEGYERNESISDCWSNETSSGRWVEVPRPSESDLVFTAYRGNQPLHVGVMLNSLKAIHCRGLEDEPGHVEIHSIKAIKSIFGKVTFHKYVGDK